MRLPLKLNISHFFWANAINFTKITADQENRINSRKNDIELKNYACGFSHFSRFLKSHRFFPASRLALAPEVGVSFVILHNFVCYSSAWSVLIRGTGNRQGNGMELKMELSLTIKHALCSIFIFRFLCTHLKSDVKRCHMCLLSQLSSARQCVMYLYP